MNSNLNLHKAAMQFDYTMNIDEQERTHAHTYSRNGRDSDSIIIGTFGARNQSSLIQFDLQNSLLNLNTIFFLPLIANKRTRISIGNF